MMPRATYRLQFNRDFTFAQAAEIVPYLAGLGISHLYASPILTARAGSTHGYDVVDHATINPELGGRAGFERLVERLHANGMGVLLDIVPNHMGVGGSDNRLWLDVLEWGRLSPYAGWFDIDWEPADPRLRGRVLLPFLGDQYGAELAAGHIALRVDDAGRLAAWYFQHCCPIAPRDYRSVFELALGQADELDRSLHQMAAATGRGAAARVAFFASRRGFADLLHRNAAARRAVDAALARFDGQTPDGRSWLHELLERQAFRLAWWRAAADEVNYRRFFTVNELAGFRVEVPAAFDVAHAVPLELWRDGLVDGFRVDHVDGLADPRAYCRKLRRRMEALAERRPAERSRQPWIVVEKILARHERLPADWQVDGSTGYEFMDAVGAVLHDPAGEAPLSDLLAEFTGSAMTFQDHALAARRQMLRDHLAAELAGAALVAHRVLQRDLATRDFTLTGVRRALAEIAAHFPVYRTYSEVGPREEDARVLDWALNGARRALRATEWPLIDALRPILTGALIRQVSLGGARREAMLALRRFQQLTGPTAAKAVEDTGFYRYVRLLSRNEVGADPSQFALPPAAFARLQRRRTPLSLLATATHDHKRGEDVRARLAVLSELPEEWAGAVRRWSRLNAMLKVEVDGAPAPSAADEYQLYQMLVGGWPPALDPADAPAVDRFRARIADWLLKAIREAKLRTDWGVGNEAYEQATLGFLQAALDPARTAPLAQEVAAFAYRLALAGMIKALTQLALKCLSIGIPDIYQGAERWDFSLVDPDNRRPVDFDALAEPADSAAPLSAADWESGRIKQWLLARLLELRRSCPEVFLQGRYVPVRLLGQLAPAMLVQLLVHETQAVLLVAPRLTSGLITSDASSAADPSELSIVLPKRLQPAAVHDVLRGETVAVTRRTRLPMLGRQLPLLVWRFGIR